MDHGRWSGLPHASADTWTDGQAFGEEQLKQKVVGALSLTTDDTNNELMIEVRLQTSTIYAKVEAQQPGPHSKEQFETGSRLDQNSAKHDEESRQ